MTAIILEFPKRERTPNRSDAGRKLDALVDLLCEKSSGVDPDEIRKSLVELKARCDSERDIA